MSKEFIATIVAAVAVLGFLWNISAQISDIKSEVGIIKGNIGELRGKVEANTAAIGELRDDVRELRGIITTHLVGHAAGHATVADAGKPKAETQ